MRTDIYAYGLILNELFTGKIPQGTMYTRVADVSPEYAFLDEVIERMIAQNPNDRYASTHAVVEDVNARWAESDKAREAMRVRQRAIEENGYSVSIVGKQWDSYNLEVRLGSIVDEDWLGCFKGYGEHVQGADNRTWGARDCEFDGDTILVRSIGTDKDLIQRVYDNIKAAIAWANEKATEELRLRELEDARTEYIADAARENYLDSYAELNSFLSGLD